MMQGLVQHCEGKDSKCDRKEGQELAAEIASGGSKVGAQVGVGGWWKG
jgi:hypothetical protein